MNKEKYVETILVLVTALVIFGLVLSVYDFFYAAVGLGLVGLFVKPLALLIHRGWMKFAEVIGHVSSTVMLSVIFYVFLSPIAFLFRIFNKDVLLLKNTRDSTFQERNHVYVKEDIEKIW